jgi:tRNA A-37 threonylcarbamoyl transferase component Bud32/tetratricopeptide (TPR) repeat protein
MTTVFQRVGRFEILSEIGRGGMASVFLAEDTESHQRVALKLVPIRGDREGREILEAERWGARLQARLSADCPLVPKVYEDGDLPSYYFIAMEYVGGENLSEVIARGPLAPADAVAVAMQVCRFLDAAHKFETTIDGRQFCSLVHGDLKPGNVRISASGEIKVLDFGIAKALSLSRKVTRNDFGSIPYMSPERLDSTESEVGRPVDLWALGVILYELLSGAPPFHARDTRRLEHEIRAGYPRTPLRDSVPAGLRAITARLLAPSLSARYESAAAVLDDLQLFSLGRQTAAEQQGFPARVDEVATRRTRPTSEEDATRRTRPQPVAEPANRPATVPVVAGPPKRRVTLRAILLAAALLLVVNEIGIGVSAGRLAALARSRDLDGMGAVWDDYARLSRRSFVRIGIIGLERTLRTRSLQLADEVIANYRGPLPTVRERQWRAAARSLDQALTLMPGDRRLTASLRYCEGHLRRIDGEAEKTRGERAAANRDFTDAVTAFREAAQLREDWPDPFLGLARTFIYGLDDIDRAADAFKQAQQRGYTIGDRETAQLGDGYRGRGDNLRQTARRLKGLPQEEEYLQRALAAYRDALGQYERCPGFAGVATNLQRVHRAIDEIALRLEEVDAEKDAIEPLGWV